MSDALGDMRRALVIGLGRSGVPAAEALADGGLDVIAVDSASSVDLPDELAGRVDVRVGMPPDAIADLVDEVDLVVPSPGVPEHAPPLRHASEAGVPVWSEPELGYRLAPHPMLGVTGTNGKTTVTKLLTEMLRASGEDVVACGNIGHPFTRAARDAGEGTVLVAELSSFQLRFVEELRTRVGVLLNVAADHLDWHGDLEAYAAAKARIWHAQGATDWAVADRDDDIVRALAERHAPGRIAWVSTDGLPDVGAGWQGDRLVARLPGFEGEVLHRDALTVDAPHHPANVAAAACAALLASASPTGILGAVRAHRPEPHRLDVVGEHAGVRWVDDSKATNPHAALAALRAVTHGSGDVVWVAGGLSRGDLTELRGGLGAVREAVLVGEAADELEAIVAEEGIASHRATTMEEAVAVAAGLARAGDVVLLAPACSSLDQYEDYVERGERFAGAVAGLGVAPKEVTHGRG